jgi:hypothetical protein
VFVILEASTRRTELSSVYLASICGVSSTLCNSAITSTYARAASSPALFVIHGCRRLVHGRQPPHIGGALSPEDNDAPEVGWFATSLRRIDLATFHHERNAAA